MWKCSLKTSIARVWVREQARRQACAWSHCRKAVYVRVSPAIEISSGAICKVKRNNMKKTTCTLRPLSRLAKILGYGRVCQNSMARASRLSKRYLMSLGASTLVPAAWTGV